MIDKPKEAITMLNGCMSNTKKYCDSRTEVVLNVHLTASKTKNGMMCMKIKIST